MNLKEITIKNFRSIANVTFKIEQIANSYAYTLIGINESGKSSFLMGIDLINRESISYPIDYFDDTKPVSVLLKYEMIKEEEIELREKLISQFSFEKSLVSKIVFNEIDIIIEFDPKLNTVQEIKEFILFTDSKLSGYTLLDGLPTKRDKTTISLPDLDLNDFFRENLPDYFWQISHVVTFWRSSPEYLIIDEIDLEKFSIDPRKTSIPLKNCFDLAGITNIKSAIAKLHSPVAIQNLEDLLSEKVTTHINKIWLEHPVKIKFKINNSKLTFLVEDKGVKFNNKTTGQRSDGFRQLISFLLTLSAENLSQELTNTILLLDEPETHLHPTAQINLKNEIIKLSQDDSNNLVFFATHSNYMIDKENIDRCFKVYKEKNKYTKFERLRTGNTSYSEVNYEVFDIPTNDYHNELYGFLEETNINKINSLPKNRDWVNDLKGVKEKVSLSKYIRHSIHHPENTKNPKFTEKELKESIELLRKLRQP